MTNLIINASMLGQSPTGLGVYSQKCVASLEQTFNCVVLSSYYQTSQQIHIPSPKSIVIGASRGAAIKRFLYSWLSFPKLEGLLYTPTHHGIFRFKNQIITIHDLIPLRFPSQHKFQFYYFKYILPKIMQDCLAIFTVSETVKNELAEHFNFEPERIFVIPNGVDQNRYFPSNPGYSSEKAYLLVVGAAYSHKNIHELLHNYKLWENKYNIKIVGSRGPYQKYLQKLVKKYHLQSSVIFMEYLSDDQLVETMQSCKALVYPSLCEGFGIPPLEVMACGRPVIISDIPVHKEICLDVPIYITPGDNTSWENAFLCLEDKQYVEQKISMGLNLAKRYTWQKSGEILIDSLLRVMPSLANKIKNL